MSQIDGVFAGGGVKGIGIVGAIAATRTLGHTFRYLAGTSAGAIIASLVAAGYDDTELKYIMDTAPYLKFRDRKTPFLGFNLWFHQGLYKGDCFQNWITQLLKDKGIETFKDVIIEPAAVPRYKYSLHIVATNLTTGKMYTLPDDLDNPDDFPVGLAVRMSMSIPYYFEPVLYQGMVITDGGTESNYPVWMFDSRPECDTIGFKLTDVGDGKPHKITGLVSLFSALFSTMMENFDNTYIHTHDFTRTIPIPSLGVSTVDFDISQSDIYGLYQAGYEAATIYWKQK